MGIITGESVSYSKASKQSLSAVAPTLLLKDQKQVPKPPKRVCLQLPQRDYLKIENKFPSFETEFVCSCSSVITQNLKTSSQSLQTEFVYSCPNVITQRSKTCGSL